jgi:hypothetical protein
MDYNHIMQQAGEVVDAAGVAVIVIGAVINAGAAAVQVAHHQAGAYRRFRQEHFTVRHFTVHEVPGAPQVAQLLAGQLVRDAEVAGATDEPDLGSAAAQRAPLARKNGS